MCSDKRWIPSSPGCTLNTAQETADSICCQVTLLVYVQLFVPPRLPRLCSAVLLFSQLVPVHITGKCKVKSNIGQTSGGHPLKLILKSRGNLKLRWSGIHHLNLKLTNYIHKAIQSVLNSISKEVFTTWWLLFLFSKHIMMNKSWYYKKTKRQQVQKNNGTTQKSLLCNGKDRESEGF